MTENGLTDRTDAEKRTRASFGPQVALVEELLALAARWFLATDWKGRRNVEGPADRLVAGEAARASKSFRAALELSLGGYGPQAAMINRSLFEGMAVAHWISANEAEAVERFEKHERHSRELWVQRLEARGRLDTPIRSDRLDSDEQRELDRMFGRFGERGWTGKSAHGLIESIQNQWPEGPSRDDLWNFFLVPHADNNQTLHSSAMALAGGTIADGEASVTLDTGPSSVQLERALLGAFWTYTQVLSLVFKRFEIPGQDDLDELYARGRASFVRVDPAVAAKTGRNEPCPCGSGRKFKKCHGS